MSQLKGWLEKKSIFGTWSRRYLILLFSKLSIFKDSSSTISEFDYELDSQTKVEASDSNDCILKVIIQKPKLVTLILKASSNNEMIDWVFHLRRSAFASKTIYISMFNVISLLGQGAHGKVMLCEKKDSKEIVAIKSVNKQMLVETKKENSVLNEKMILASIHNPFIINLKYAFQNDKYYFLALEYAPGGNLFNRLKNGKIPLTDIKLYVAELAIAIHELHINHIIYRDLKPGNVMIGKDGHLKITDFGISIFCEPNETKTEVCGTPEYIAPELILNKGYGYRVDWWGLGVLVYELLYKSTPFAGLNNCYIFQSILNKEPVFPKNEDPVIVSFLSSLLQKDPSKRGGYRYIVSSEFMSDIDFHQVYKKKISPSYIPEINSIIDTSNFEKKYTGKKLCRSDSDIFSDQYSFMSDSQFDVFSFNCTNDDLE